jgi:hypothetical protein
LHFNSNLDQSLVAHGKQMQESGQRAFFYLLNLSYLETAIRYINHEALRQLAVALVHRGCIQKLGRGLIRGEICGAIQNRAVCASHWNSQSSGLLPLFSLVPKVLRCQNYLPSPDISLEKLQMSIMATFVSLFSSRGTLARLSSLSINVAIALTALQPFAPAQSQNERPFKIPANTVIRVRTIENVSSETARVGDIVPMEVLGDVLVNGFVVARQGAPAVGEISRVKEARSMGRRGHVALTLSYVEALTGEHILVSGNRAEKGNGKAAKLAAEIVVTTAVTGGLVGALWLFEKGHDTSIPPGTAFSVYTVGDTTIDLSLLAPHAAPQATPALISAGSSPVTSSAPLNASKGTEGSPLNQLPRAMSSAPTAFPALGVVVRTKTNLGAEVVGIAADGAAAKTGLKVGDVIGAVDGNRTTSVRDLASALANRAPGTAVRLSWFFRSNLGWMPTPETVLILAGSSDPKAP